MGVKVGNIIAVIITAHIPRNDANICSHVCPGMRIHAIDIVQPPGMGISLIADMEAHQAMVAAALTIKSSAEAPKNTRFETGSEAAQHACAGAITCVNT
jgi:hypothetical protein